MDIELENEKANIIIAAGDRARWLKYSFPEIYEHIEEEALARMIFKKEVLSRRSGESSIFTKEKSVPDLKVPIEEEEDFWNV